MKTTVFFKLFVRAFTIFVISTVFVFQLNANTAGSICVSADGNDANSGSIVSPLRNIQTALNKAAVGDTVKVAAGTYSEALTTKVSVILLGGYTKSFSASNRDIFQNKTFISGVSANMYTDAKGSTIDGFIFSCTSSVTGDALLVSSNSYVSHNIVQGLTSNAGNSAIDITGGAIVKNNIFKGGWYAMSINSGTGTPNIRNNIITGSTFGLQTNGYSETVRTYNDVFGNTFNYVGNSNPGKGDISSNPLFKNPTDNDYRILETSPCRDAGDPADSSEGELAPYNAHIDIGAYGGTKYSPYLPQVPGAPNLVSPGNNALQLPRNPVLKWNKINEVSSYHLQVSTSSTFISGIISDNAALTDTFTQISNLSLNTTYYWRVNASVTLGTSVWSNVFSFTTMPVPQTPTIQASALVISEVGKNSAKVSWQNGNGSGSIVFVKPDIAGSPVPADYTSYNAGTSYGTGSQIGTSGWFCVYKGTASSTILSDLEPGTKYRAAVLAYNGGDGDEKYMIETNASNIQNFTTLCDFDFYGSNPTVHLYYKNPGTYDVEITLSHSCGTTKFKFFDRTLSGSSFNLSVSAYPNSGSMQGTLSSDGKNFSGTYNISFAYLHPTYGYPVSCGTRSGNWSAALKPCSTTGIVNIGYDNFVYFPNPASKVLYFNGIYDDMTTVSIYSTGGKLLKLKREQKPDQLNISDLADGIYLLRIVNSKQNISKTFIKRNR